MLRDVEAATSAMGLQLQIVKASTSREIDAAFATFVRERPERFLSAAVPFCSAGVSNWPPSGASRGSPRPMDRANMPKPAG